jgi:hypothetical protein
VKSRGPVAAGSAHAREGVASEVWHPMSAATIASKPAAVLMRLIVARSSPTRMSPNRTTPRDSKPRGLVGTCFARASGGSPMA